MYDKEETAVSVYTSFAAADRSLATDLASHMDVLRRIGKLETRSAYDAPPGEDHAAFIKSALTSADVALVLLSKDWLADEGIQSIEVPQLRASAELRALRIVPVVLRSCDWRNHPLVRGKAHLPRDATPIASLQEDSRDQAMVTVVRELSFLLGDPAFARTKAGRSLGTGAGTVASPRALDATSSELDVRVFLEHVLYYDEFRLVIVNISPRPVTVAEVSVALAYEAAATDAPQWDPVPRGHFFAGNTIQRLPARLDDGDYIVLPLSETTSESIRTGAAVQLAVYDILGRSSLGYTRRIYNPKWGYYRDEGPTRPETGER